MEVKAFQSLTKDEKIDFFLRCQQLLVANHPDSKFIIREGDQTSTLSHVKSLLNRYQGLTYIDTNIAILFNKILVTDPKDAAGTIKLSMFQPPHKEYNAVSIDFVVFDKLDSCLEWVKKQYEPRIQYVVYIKNGTPQLYKTEKLISRIFQIPLAVLPPVERIF